MSDRCVWAAPLPHVADAGRGELALAHVGVGVVGDDRRGHAPAADAGLGDLGVVRDDMVELERLDVASLGEARGRVLADDQPEPHGIER